MSAAAEEFGRTQPAISQAIGALEEETGVELFDRSVRPPVLTMRGAAFLQHATAVVESIRRMEDSLRLGETAQLPLLRIGMQNSFAVALGPAVIRRLQNTAVRWQVDTGFNATRIVALLDRRLDFLVSADETPVPPPLISLPLFSEPYVAVLPAELGTSPRAAREAMATMSMISFGQDPNMISHIELWLEKAAIRPQQRFHLDSVDGTVAMVAAGLGWSLLPPLAIIRMLERGDHIRAVALGGTPRRTVAVLARRGEGEVIAGRLRQTAADLIAETVLPSIKAHLPDVHDQVRLLCPASAGRAEISPSRGGASP